MLNVHLPLRVSESELSRAFVLDDIADNNGKNFSYCVTNNNISFIIIWGSRHAQRRAWRSLLVHKRLDESVSPAIIELPDFVLSPAANSILILLLQLFTCLSAREYVVIFHQIKSAKKKQLVKSSSCVSCADRKASEFIWHLEGNEKASETFSLKYHQVKI